MAFSPVYIVVTIVSCCVLEVFTIHPNHGDQLGRPNIIFILADDAGWNDFSFHGSAQIPTPNIDALALSGTILNSYYTSPLCTPTRGAIMTGKHPIHLGLQHYVVRGSSSGGLPLKEKLLPAYLKEFGYATHLVGKWHLGHSRKEYLPTERGFDTHLGYWLGKQDYYTHMTMDGKDETGNWCWGYDFRNNTLLERNAFSKYSTDIFTNEAVRLINNHPSDNPLFLMLTHMAPHSANSYDPLQAPLENIEKFKLTIPDRNRGKYAAMVDKMDESVGLVVDALSKRGMLTNSIIVFASDNGGSPEGYDLNYGSNWPLRGVKNSLWEGGTRVAAAIWGLPIKNRVSRDLMHVQDWLPTLYEAAGGDVSNLKGLDGISMWKTLTQGNPSPRTSVLYNIDNSYNVSALRDGPWKVIKGKQPTQDLGASKDWDLWYAETKQDAGDSNTLIPQILSSLAAKAIVSSGFNLSTNALAKVQADAVVVCTRQVEHTPCDPYQAPCLFHLDDDPCELWNVAEKESATLQRLLSMIDEHNKTVIPSTIRKMYPDGFASNWGNVWTTWEDNMDYLRFGSEGLSSTTRVTYSAKFTFVITFGLLLALVN